MTAYPSLSNALKKIQNLGIRTHITRRGSLYVPRSIINPEALCYTQEGQLHIHLLSWFKEIERPRSGDYVSIGLTRVAPLFAHTTNTSMAITMHVLDTSPDCKGWWWIGDV